LICNKECSVLPRRPAREGQSPRSKSREVERILRSALAIGACVAPANRFLGRRAPAGFKIPFGALRLFLARKLAGADHRRTRPRCPLAIIITVHMRDWFAAMGR
jgi:hypothetical protein